jgi:ubiquinone biosynthesis protein
LFDGFFHGDPHPGNLMINPRTGVITLIDCGLVGELSQAQRMDFLDLIWSFTRKDVRGLSDVFFRLCRQTRRVDKPAYYATMDRIIYQYVVYNAGANFGSLMNAVLGSLYEMGLRMDSNLTLAIKAIMQMEEAACALDPGHDLGRVATEYAQAHLREQLTAEKVSSMAQEQVIRLGREVARRLPELQDASMKWLDMFTKGGLEVKLDTSGLSEQMTQLDVILRRLVIGLVLAGLIVGTAIVASSPFLASRSDLPAVATAVFVVVVVASLLVVWRMARNSKPTGRL